MDRSTWRFIEDEFWLLLPRSIRRVRVLLAIDLAVLAVSMLGITGITYWEAFHGLDPGVVAVLWIPACLVLAVIAIPRKRRVT